jgi:initiation factor 1A
MVKNTHGGNRHKAFARKHSGPAVSSRIRTSVEEGELYAIVTKMLGNNMFHCHCIDNVVRLGHIRGKFSGRRKSGHMLSSGTWILVGLREWDVDASKTMTSSGKTKLSECDLLEVYDEASKERLMELERREWNILKMNDVSRSSTKEEKMEEDGLFRFATDKDEEIDRLLGEMSSTNTTRIAFREEEKDQDNEEINIDDI